MEISVDEKAGCPYWDTVRYVDSSSALLSEAANIRSFEEAALIIAGRAAHNGCLQA